MGCDAGARAGGLDYLHGMQPAVFLDRDDTLIRANSLPAPKAPANRGDVTDPSDVQLLEGVREACTALKRAGFVLVVYSNQGGVARGAISLRTVEAINDRVRSEIGRGIIDAFYVCPFHPSGRVPALTREHAWRKPGGGMIQSAAAELSLDLSRSWAVGDAERDVEAAVGAGIAPERCIRIDAEGGVGDMAAAAKVILEGTRRVQAARSTMRLTALEGTPLADSRTRATVIAAAGAIAERTGIPLAALEADIASITISLDADRLTCLGFLAELRRNTNSWFAARNGGRSLWGEVPEG